MQLGVRIALIYLMRTGTAKVGLGSRLRGCSNALVDTVVRFADVRVA